MKIFDKYFNIIFSAILSGVIVNIWPENNSFVVYAAALLTVETADRIQKNDDEAKNNTGDPDAEQANPADRYPAYKVPTEQQA